MKKPKRTSEERALRAAYTKMRDTAHKRIKRLSRQFGEKEVQNRFLRKYGQDFPKLRDMNDDVKIARAFNDIKKFLENENTTTVGYRKGRELYNQSRIDTVDKFKEYGYDFITLENLDTVIDFLEDSKDRADSKLLDSDEIIDIAVNAAALKIDPIRMKNGFTDYEKMRNEISVRMKKMDENEMTLSSKQFRDRWL